MIIPDKLRPFKRLCITVGNLPTSYLETMSYYETLCWLCKYLKTEVIPALNNNAEALEELQAKFVELENYVNDYFSNLDVQEEINNKLDEMADSEELQNIISLYLQLSPVLAYETLSDMKLAENLSNGSLMKTYGYSEVNDNGGAFYKARTKTEDDTPDDMTIIQLHDSSLVAELIKQDEFNVKQFGAKGDGETDDTKSIQKCFEIATENGSTVKFDKGEYVISDSITINDNTKDVVVKGNSATLSFTETEVLEYNALTLTANKVIIDNLNVDGTNTTQDQFDQTTFSDLRAHTGFNIKADDIELKNLKLSNWYGNGIIISLYNNVLIENVLIDSVGGHWYQNDTHDSFGDAVRFGGHTGTSNIVINNFDAIGKYKNNTLSRIGIVVENLDGVTDELTYINVNNANLLNYDRGIHVESVEGKVKINYNGGNIFSNVSVFSHTLNETYFYGDNIKFDYNDGNYGGSHGIRSVDFNIKNSIINCDSESLASYGSTGVYENCTINNITNTQFINVDPVKFINCKVNLGTLTTYLAYNSNVEFIDCTFESASDQRETTAGYPIKCRNCKFIKTILHFQPTDLNNVINMSNSFTYNGTDEYNLSACTLYKNDTLHSEPNLSKTFPVNNLEIYKYYGYRTIPESGTIALYPSFTNTVLRPNSKYLLITIGSNDWTHVSNGRNFQNYYYNVITTDSSGNITIGDTQTVGNPATGGYELTISSNTIARNGLYSSIAIQWLLPYYFNTYMSTFE